MTRCDDVWTLLHALRTKRCQWASLSDSEVEEHMESIRQREAAGEAVGRRRKERADKGKKRKRRSRDNQDSEECPDSADDNEASRTRAKSKGKKRDTGGHCLYTNENEDSQARTKQKPSKAMDTGRRRIIKSRALVPPTSSEEEDN